MSEVKIIDLPEKQITPEDYALIVDDQGQHYKGLYSDIAARASDTLLESGEVADILQKASRFSATGRPVNPSSAPLTDEYLVQAIQAGTYTNFTGLVVSLEEIKGIVRLVKIGSVWSKDVKPLDYDLNGAFVNNNRELKGAFVPVVQFQHVRGEAEMVGNGSYIAAKGVDFNEQMAVNTVFNKVEFPAWVAGDVGNVIVRVYKGTTNRNNPSLLTLLGEKITPAADFNKSGSGFASILFPTAMSVNAGESVCVYIHGGSQGIRFKYWTTASSAPPRGFFAYTNNSSETWDAAWTISEAGFYSSTFRLSLIDSVIENQLVDLKKNSLTGKDRLVIAWQHPRGETEYLGDATYRSRGGGSFQALTADTYFNQIELPFFVTESTGDAEIRIFSATGGANPGAMTLLASQVVAFSEFNKNPEKMMSFIFDAPIFIPTGQRIYAFVWCGSTGYINFRYWTTAGSSPARNVFTYTNLTADAWTSNWGVSSSGYWGASLRLSMVDVSTATNVRKLSQELDKLDTPDVIENPFRLLTISEYVAVVGVPLSIYYDAIVLGKDNGLHGPTDCTVSIECAIGVSANRYWRLTPTTGQIGTRTITFRVYDSKGEISIEKSSILRVIANDAPATAKNYCLVGDSTTFSATSAGGARKPFAVNERMAATTGGVKATARGNRGVDPYKHEGHSEWEVGSFTGAGLSNPAPPGNPFYNTTTGQLDAANFCSIIGLPGGFLDVISFELGINNSWGGGNIIPDSYIQTAVIDRYNILIDLWLAHNANTIIIIQVPLTEKSVNWTTPPIKKAIFRRNMWRIREMLIAAYDNGAYNARVKVGQAGFTMDRYWGYPQVTQVVGPRYTETSIEITDNVHPRTEGYYEEADGIFPILLRWLQ